MTTQHYKRSTLIALYIAAHFLEACGLFGPICDCPDVQYPFFDYKKIVLQANDPNTNLGLQITITPDSIDLVAQAAPQFRLSTSAYGCSCNGDGDEGDKYAPLSMDVFADRAFNDTLPAGASLRSLFKGRTNGDLLAPLSAEFKPEKFDYVGGAYSISTDERPTQLGEPYHFQVKWVKANGDTLVAFTDAVVFQ